MSSIHRHLQLLIANLISLDNTLTPNVKVSREPSLLPFVFVVGSLVLPREKKSMLFNGKAGMHESSTWKIRAREGLHLQV